VEAARAASVRRFVLVSSLAVYAANQLPEGGTLDETCPIDPAPERRSAYAYSKIVQEDVCRVEGSGRGVPVVIVRPGVIYGPGRSCLSDRVGPRVGRWTAVVDAGRPLPYTFLSNCAEAVALSAIARGIDDTAVNVVDDELPTGRDIVDTCRLAGETIRAVALSSGTARAFARAYEWYYQLSDGMVPPGFLPARVGPLFKSLRYSNARAKATLGWTPRVELRTALALTAGQRAA
jgi:nucleoside-diphosphate-sugar epimerase